MQSVYLTAEQQQAVALPMLQQAEARTLEAWVNHQLNPADKALQAHYEQLREQLAWLEGEVGQWASFSP